MQEQECIFITRDRDFGRLVFIEHIKIGVIYLRILPATLNEVHKELEKVIKYYSEDELKKSFVVVEPGKHRIRKM